MRNIGTVKQVPFSYRQITVYIRPERKKGNFVKRLFNEKEKGGNETTLFIFL